MNIPYNLCPLGTKQGMPLGYTPLEFLQSTGGQQINTGRQATDQTCIEVKYADTNISNWTPLVCTLNSYSQGYAVLATGTTSAGNGPRFDYGNHPLSLPGMDIRRGRHIMRKEGARNFIDGVEVKANNSMPASTWTELCLLYFAAMAAYTQCKLYSYKKWELGEPVQQHFVPALDPSGTPCMFDLVSKQPFKNVGSGQFVAGIGTVAQLTILLRNLPATGGALTISLPAEANTPEVADMLQACHDTQGWALTVHEYRTAAAATYSLRRVRSVVWCRCEQAEYGSYVADDGTRWQIERCAAIFGAKGQHPADYGYTPFDSVEDAAEQWNLTPYIEPEMEEQP